MKWYNINGTTAVYISYTVAPNYRGTGWLLIEYRGTVCLLILYRRTGYLLIEYRETGYLLIEYRRKWHYRQQWIHGDIFGPYLIHFLHGWVSVKINEWKSNIERKKQYALQNIIIIFGFVYYFVFWKASTNSMSVQCVYIPIKNALNQINAKLLTNWQFKFCPILNTLNIFKLPNLAL